MGGGAPVKKEKKKKEEKKEEASDEKAEEAAADGAADDAGEAEPMETEAAPASTESQEIPQRVYTAEEAAKNLKLKEDTEKVHAERIAQTEQKKLAAEAADKTTRVKAGIKATKAAGITAPEFDTLLAAAGLA